MTTVKLIQKVDYDGDWFVVQIDEKREFFHKKEDADKYYLKAIEQVRKGIGEKILSIQTIETEFRNL